MLLAARKMRSAYKGLFDWTEPERLYHYTDLKALQGIIESGKMWATHSRFLNDPLEVAYGEDLCKKVIFGYCARKSSKYKAFDRLGKQLLAKGLREGSTASYCVSFCAKGDGLVQWQLYGKGGQGVSIGFDFSKLRASMDWEEEEEEENMGAAYRLIKIEYDKNQQMKMCRKLWQEARKAYTIVEGESEKRKERFANWCVNRMLALALSFKQEGLRDEDEWRAVPVYMGDNYPKDLKFRESNGLLVPYLEMRVTAGLNKPLPPIREIIFGPVMHDSSIEESIRLLLESNGYRQELPSFPKVFGSKTKLNRF